MQRSFIGHSEVMIHEHTSFFFEKEKLLKQLKSPQNTSTTSKSKRVQALEATEEFLISSVAYQHKRNTT